MEMKRVESSNIESIGYDENTKELRVKFTGSQAVYSYKDVPRDKFNELSASQSVGKFLHKEIKNVFVCDKVKPDGKENS